MEINNMKKILYSTLCVAGMLAATSCEDYLETTSSSVVDADFVFSNSETARAAMDGAYEQWRAAGQGNFFGDGLYYAVDVCGSDIERHPEKFSNQPKRHYAECLYQNGTYAEAFDNVGYQTETGCYSQLYNVIAKANAVISSMESAANYDEIIGSATTASALSQMYGEAIAMRASAYRELIKYYGDVPFVTVFGEASGGLASRDSIYDKCIEDLIRVEPLMFEVGTAPGFAGTNKNYFSKTYVQGLIGRMCLDAGGYQTRRTDLGTDFYKDGDGKVLQYETKGNENNQAVYGRRSDWQELYKIAKTYYAKVLASSGTATLHLTDPRSNESNGRIYENPYQYFFQQMHMDDAIYADESIYEYPMQQGGGNDARNYSYGRVSSGGGSNAYPCKAYGQGRINPAYYYGIFDPNDKRRDVSVATTGSTGKGAEKLIPFVPNSKADGGGLSLNKWDENRQESPWTTGQRKSGINGPYMRMSEIYLGYAEVCAALGDDVTAKQLLSTIRERSFPAGKANVDGFIAECGSMHRAVIEERGFEFAGEGDRRWTLIRSGYLPDAIKRIKELTRAMIDGLAANGYYEFDNGNVISNYVWTKLVDAKSVYGYRLTTQCPEGMEDDPVLYPGWRGQHDDWKAASQASTQLDDKKLKEDVPMSNLAIKGLFKRISDEAAAALEADGYTKQNWGADLVEYDDEYYKYLFYDYDYVSAPIYLWPYTPNTVATGGFTNGYGFSQD